MPKKRKKKDRVWGRARATAVCPFYVKEKNGYVYCEGCRMCFKDAVHRREIIYRLCAHPDGYKSCRIYAALVKYYEERTKNNENQK